ncbi:MAG: LPO_1073/Vpar_1526 family protein [Pyrinomonadaceae bacterium]
MIKDKTQQQESGDNSANYQAETINQYGLSYRDAKEIALDVFRENFTSLSEQARNIAKERAEELVDSFLNEVKEKNPDLLNTVQEPSMQLALYSAQKSYVKTGDKDVADLLVDILVDRAEQTERNLKQIVLDESLEVVPKLTNEQLDILTIVFVIKYSINNGLVNLETLKEYLETCIKPFTDGLTKENSAYQHLEYCNCGTVSVLGNSIEAIFLANYKGVFCKGIVTEECLKEYGNILRFPHLLTSCLHDRTKLQINAINDDVLKEQISRYGLSEEESQKLTSLFASNVMNESEVKEYLSKQGDFMVNLLDVWQNSSMRVMTITSVGIAIAQANYKRKTGQSIDLSIWIK